MAEDSNTTLRACSKCGVEKPATFDHFDNYRDRGVLRQRAFCRDCLNARTRSYRAANPEMAGEWDRRNQERNRGAGSGYEKRRYARRDKEKARSDLKRWKEANPVAVKAMEKRNAVKNRAVHSARMLRWIKENPQKVAIIRNRRRAREVDAHGDYTIDDVRSLLRSYGRVCFYCDVALTKFHVDHFIPLARGGSNGPENLRLSCPPCNWSKGGKMPWEWMPQRFTCSKTG